VAVIDACSKLTVPCPPDCIVLLLEPANSIRLLLPRERFLLLLGGGVATRSGALQHEKKAPFCENTCPDTHAEYKYTPSLKLSAISAVRAPLERRQAERHQIR